MHCRSPLGGEALGPGERSPAEGVVGVGEGPRGMFVVDGGDKKVSKNDEKRDDFGKMWLSKGTSKTNGTP